MLDGSHCACALKAGGIHCLLRCIGGFVGSERFRRATFSIVDIAH